MIWFYFYHINFNAYLWYWFWIYGTVLKGFFRTYYVYCIKNWIDRRKNIRVQNSRGSWDMGKTKMLCECLIPEPHCWKVDLNFVSTNKKYSRDCLTHQMVTFSNSTAVKGKSNRGHNWSLKDREVTTCQDWLVTTVITTPRKSQCVQEKVYSKRI